MVSAGGSTCGVKSIIEERSCFDGCCAGDFYCHKSKKCVGTKASRCNYIDNCGNKEDEADYLCKEACKKQ